MTVVQKRFKRVLRHGVDRIPAYERLDMFVDLALAYALLSFVGAIAAARYFERGGQHR